MKLFRNIIIPIPEGPGLPFEEPSIWTNSKR